MKILAVIAHPDDESVGLFTLKDKIVSVAIWNQIEEIPKYRMDELFNLAREMSWKVYSDVLDAVVEEMIYEKKVDTIAIPNLDSRHPAHLLASTAVYEQWLTSWRSEGIRLIFYDVEIKEPWSLPLKESEAKAKKSHLMKYYPSQRDLWLSDGKYWLFEGHVMVI